MDPYTYAVAASIHKPTLFREVAERYWHEGGVDPRVATSRGHSIRCGCAVCSWPPRLRAAISNGFCAQCRHALDDHGKGGKCVVAA